MHFRASGSFTLLVQVSTWYFTCSFSFLSKPFLFFCAFYLKLFKNIFAANSGNIHHYEPEVAELMLTNLLARTLSVSVINWKRETKLKGSHSWRYSPQKELSIFLSFFNAIFSLFWQLCLISAKKQTATERESNTVKVKFKFVRFLFPPMEIYTFKAGYDANVTNGNSPFANRHHSGISYQIRGYG